MRDTEKKIYALQTEETHRNGKIFRQYYTGEKPSPTILRAKLFTLRYAKSTRDFAYSGWQYQIIKVPEVVRFKMALQGK